MKQRCTRFRSATCNKIEWLSPRRWCGNCQQRFAQERQRRLMQMPMLHAAIDQRQTADGRQVICLRTIDDRQPIIKTFSSRVGKARQYAQRWARANRVQLYELTPETTQ